MVFLAPANNDYKSNGFFGLQRLLFQKHNKRNGFIVFLRLEFQKHCKSNGFFGLQPKMTIKVMVFCAPAPVVSKTQ